MGQRGPIPKRADRPGGYRPETRARKAASGADGISRAPSRAAAQPKASADWDPIAKRMWKAVGESGQSIFYEPSDWAVLYSLMDDLTYYKSQPRRSGQMLQTIMSSLTTLLLTEGDRRRLQVELSGAEPETTTPGAEEVEKWLSTLTPPTETEASPTSDRSD